MSCAGLYRSVQACTSLTDVQESSPYTGLYRFVQTSFVCTNSIIFADKRNVSDCGRGRLSPAPPADIVILMDQIDYNCQILVLHYSLQCAVIHYFGV